MKKCSDCKHFIIGGWYNVDPYLACDIRDSIELGIHDDEPGNGTRYIREFNKNAIDCDKFEEEKWPPEEKKQ